MTAQRRLKRTRVGPRLKALAAVLEAEGQLSKTEIARSLLIGRETLRTFRHGEDGPAYEGRIATAQRRLAAGFSREQIVDDLTEAHAPVLELEPPTAKAQWAALQDAATYYASLAAAYNVGRTTHFLVTDPKRLIQLAAEHLGIGIEVGAGKLEPGHPEVDSVTKVFLNACISSCPTVGAFAPWKPFPYPKETEP